MSNWVVTAPANAVWEVGSECLAPHSHLGFHLVMTRSLLATALGLLLFSTHAQAEILSVGPDPGRYDHTTIQSAIDAASSGDTVQVAPGTYDGFFMISKSVNVIGAGSDRTVLRATTQDSGGQEIWSSTISVWDVTAQPVAIGGFRIEPFTAGLFEGSYGVNLDRTVVPIHIFDIEVIIDRPLLALKYQYRAPFLQFLVFDAIYSNCRTTLVPGWEPWAIENPQDYKGVPGMHILEGNAWISHCRFEGLPGPVCGDDQPDTLFGDFNLAAGPGLQHRDGRLTLAACQILGAAGSPAVGDCEATAGAPGLHRQVGFTGDYTSRIQGGPGNLIRGGSAFQTPGPALQLDTPDDAVIGAGVVLQPGIAQDGTPAPTVAEPFAGLGVYLLDNLPSLQFSEAVVGLGDSTQLQLHGDRFAAALTRWSPTTTDPFQVPNITGDIFLEPTLFGELPVVFLDNNGLGVLNVQIPNDPALLDSWYAIQMIELDGDIEVTPPVHLALRP